MKLKRSIAAFLAVVMISGISAFAAPTSSPAPSASPEPEKEYSDEYQAFEQIAGYISELYIDPSVTAENAMKHGISELMRDDEDMLIRLLKSMLGSLDEYSEFFTAEEYMKYLADLNKVFYGIGVVIQRIGDYVTITNFTEGSAAQNAGCQIEDKIAAVDGIDMKGKNLSEVRNAVMGELGTTARLTLLRGEQVIEISVPRSEVKQETVSYNVIGDVGYIKITNMAEKTAEEFAAALKAMDEEKITKIVLDLRNNGGGYVQCAIDIAQMIVPKGKIVDTVYRQEQQNKSYMSELENPKYTFNVLINENTASAAEILASAMQDSGVAKLVGDTTYGKAVIQNMYTLANGSVFKLTIGHYVTRNGKEINLQGIKPDEFETNISNPIDTSLYTPFDYKTKWEPGMSGEGVKAAKERLYFLGRYVHEIDETYDQAAVEAVKRFQEDNGLYPYGILDISTQVKLENAFAKLEVMDDLQLKKAFQMFGVDLEAYQKEQEEK